MIQQQSNYDKLAPKSRNTVEDWTSKYGVSNKALSLGFSVNKTFENFGGANDVES